MYNKNTSYVIIELPIIDPGDAGYIYQHNKNFKYYEKMYFFQGTEEGTYKCNWK